MAFGEIVRLTLIMGIFSLVAPSFGATTPPVFGGAKPVASPIPVPAKKVTPPILLERIERVPTKSFPAETEENLTEFRRDVQRQWKKCLQLNDLRVIQAKDFRVTVRELCVETSRRTHHLLLISKNWKQFYQRSREQFAWYRSVADSDKKVPEIDVRLLPLSMIPMKNAGEFYFPIPKKLLSSY